MQGIRIDLEIPKVSSHRGLSPFASAFVFIRLIYASGMRLEVFSEFGWIIHHAFCTYILFYNKGS